MKNAKRALSLLLSLMLVLGAVAVGGMSASADGDGIVFNSADNRYEISTYSELKEFASIVNGTHATIAQNQAACAILTQDFTATDTDWTPIGNNYDHQYNGTFDGMRHIITGLTTPEGYESYAGLFGCVGEGGKVMNVGLEGGSITGTYNVGGVLGYSHNNSSIENCYNTGAVSGSNFVGGVVGYSYDNSSVENCYNTGDVSGNDYVGGVVGNNSENSSVKNCYNTGSVTATGQYAFVGGVAGYNSNSSIENCYNTGSVTAQGDNAFAGGVVGNNFENSSVKNCYNTGSVTATEQFACVGGVAGRSFENSSIENCYNTGDVSGGDYVGGVVGLNQESSVVNCFYDSDRVSSAPAIGFTNDETITIVKGLNTADMTGTNAADNMKGLFNNDGSSDDWYITASYPRLIFKIENYGQLKAFSARVNNGDTGLCAKLMNDIDASASASANDWTPIGNDCNQYTGTFDGDGHIITGLTFNKPQQDFAGLFGLVCEGGKVRDVGLEGGSVSGDDFVGGVVGYNDNSKVSNCYNTGAVSGSNHVGGVVGENFNNSSVENCYNTGTVSGYDSVGGVVGLNYYNSSVENCYNTGSITATATYAFVGGVVGYNYDNSSVKNCYNTGSITATATDAYAGGVVGYNYSNSTISNCYNTGSVTAQGDSAYVGGVVGENYSNSTISNCYNTGSVTAQGDNAYAGGVAGANYFGNSSVKNCCYDSDRAPGISAIGAEVDATSSNVAGLTTAQMTGGNPSDSPWLKKADGYDEASGKYYWFYPHLKGFDFEKDGQRVEFPAGVDDNCAQMAPDDIEAADWPAKAEVAVTLSEYSFGYDGLPHIPTVTSVTVGDSSAPEGASVTYSQYKYSAEDDKWEWDEVSDSPTVPGNYRMEFDNGDKVIETKYFTILDPYTDYTVSYYKSGTPAESPVNAGNYKAVVTFTDTGYAKGHTPIEKEFEITPAPVTLTAGSAEESCDGSVKTVTGFTSSVSGLTFEGVTASGSGTDIGIYDVTFNGVTLNETKDTTGNYVVTETVNGTLTINPLITFVNENGTELQSGAVAYGETPEYTGETPVKTENDGYTYEFSEWTPEITAATANATYTAAYTKTANKYTATFTADGKTVAEVPFTVETKKLDEPAVPAKEGYTGKWSEYTLGTADITITAEYTAIEYKATFIADGKTIKEVKFTVETEKLDEPAVPAKEGYTGKWSEYTLGTADITITSEYTANEYTITYVVDGKKTEVKYAFGAAVSKPANPTKEGFTFDGWDKDIPATMPAENLTITAKFSPVPSTEVSEIEFTGSLELLEKTRLYGMDNGFSVKGDIPKGAKVEWYVNGEKAGEGRNFIVTEPKADYTVQAKLVDAQGNVLSETDEANIDINTGFFARLYWFFCSLIQRIIDVFKGTAA